MGWRDLGCYGSPFYETPHLDLLAQRGMRFTDAYAACPVCSPTRASIMTGRYPARLGITNWIGGDERGRLISSPYVRELAPEETSIATVLSDAGYATWHVGKWHLGPEHCWPEHHGFDVNVGGFDQGGPGRHYFSPYKNPRLEDGPEGEYLTDRLTDEAVNLIEGAEDDTPFFMYLSHYAVHTPIMVPDKYLDKYEKKAKALGLDRVPTFDEGDLFPCEHKKDGRIKRRLVQSDPAYAGMVQNLDENLGRVFEALERTGQADHTVIVFTSDNGGLATAEGSPTCNAPLAEGKGWMYEGGTREPLLVYWPGVTEGDSVCTTPVTSTDFFPTLLEMAGLRARPELHRDGVSLVGLLKGGDRLPREGIFWHYPHYGNQGGTPGSSVRVGDYKLIEFFETGEVELYNLRDDVSEEIDLADAEPERREHLKALLEQWRESLEARIPEPNVDFVPWRDEDLHP